MFFLGGINSILPVIIYISIIWICLIIGYGNRAKDIANSLTTRSNIITYPDFQKSGKYYVLEKESDKVTTRHTSIKRIKYFAPGVSSTFIPAILPLTKYAYLHEILYFPDYFTSYHYRGPPSK